MTPIAPLVDAALSPGGQLAIGGLQAFSQFRQGEESFRIGEERARIDEATAEAVRISTVEEAEILGERGRRFVAGQTSDVISSGIRSNVGVPLLLKAQTQADIAKDIGFTLKGGRVESKRLRSSAAIERRVGRARRARSRFNAIGTIAQRGLPFLATGV